MENIGKEPATCTARVHGPGYCGGSWIPGRRSRSRGLRARRARRGARGCWRTSPARSRPRASPPASGSRHDPELADAFAALDAGETERGLDALIDAIAATSDEDRRDELRHAVVGVLDELGVEHPLARESRRKLAAALY